MAGFDHIIGHEQIISYFKKAAAAGNFSHAYILAGEEGMGKLMLARAFAMAILCKTHDACGHCSYCKQVMTGNHPDLYEIRRPEDKRNIVVDQVRDEIVATAGILPYQADKKIYIIDGADDMNEQAQNALLKTIEEPPSYVIMILLASKPERLLQTIHSRCSQINLRPVPDEKILHFLQSEHQVDGHKAQISTAFARGNVGKAIALSGSESFFELFEDTMTILKGMYERPVYEHLAKLKSHKDEISEMLDIMRLWYRDLAVYKSSQDGSLLVFGEEEATIAYFSENLTFESLDRAQNLFNDAAAKLEANVSLELTMQHMLLAIKA